MKRDVLTRLDGRTKDGRGKKPDTPKVSMIVEPELDEPTWEVRSPHSGRSGMRRFDARARSILTAAAITAVVVNAGVAWTYWRVSEADTGAPAGTAVELTLRARSDLNVPLAAGARGNLTVTLTNDYDFPIRITSVKAAPGKAVADDEHREAGCKDPAVDLTQKHFDVQWDVQKNTIGAFTIPEGMIRGAGGHPACEGGVFTIPIQVSGVSQPNKAP